MDFQYFIWEFIGLRLWRWQKQLADDTQAAVDSDLYFNWQFLGPADHGKSSGIVVPLVLWLLARNRQHHLILLGNKDSYIQQISRAAKTRIEMSEKLRSAYGLRPGLKWSDEEWYIERPDPYDRIPSVLAIGVGAEIQSQRADFLLGDDVLTRRNSRTESQRQGLDSYLETDAGSRLDKTKRTFGGGKQLLYGHRVHPDDGYKKREGKTTGVDMWVTKKYRAILDDAKQEILCPEAHTYEELAAKRSADVIGFTLLYQQESAQMGTFITQTSMEAVRRTDLRFHGSSSSINRAEYTMIWMSLDPAFSQNRWSSHAVWELWGKTLNGKRRLLWAFRDKVTPEALLNISEMKFRLFMPDHFIYEGNQGQVLIGTHMKRRFPEHDSKFIRQDTTFRDGELDNEIVRMFDDYSCEAPRVELPFGGPTEQAYVLAKTSEFTAYPDGPRDTIMCEYVGLKRMGLIKQDERRGYVDQQGGIRAVGQMYRDTTPLWRQS